MAIFIELLLIGVGLSMDAFAVSICKGLAMRRVNKKQALVIGLFFGGFQALMPFIGWALGTQFESYITSIDHWIAFVLLAFIGGKMIAEAVRPEDENVEIDKMDPPLDLKRDACAGGGDQYRCTCGRNYIRIFELSDRGGGYDHRSHHVLYLHRRRLCRQFFGNRYKKKGRTCWRHHPGADRREDSAGAPRVCGIGAGLPEVEIILRK